MQSQPEQFNIGITGVMGSGKSLVGSILASVGVLVLDTDQVVHALYDSPDVVSQLVDHYGSVILADTGELSRPGLAQIVFNSPDEKKWLEAFIHPLVRKETQAFLNNHTGVKAVLVPLLFESDSAGLYDVVWAVTVSDEKVLIDRIQKRNPQWSLEEIQSRFRGQWSQAKKTIHAMACIDNSHTPEETKETVLELLRQTVPPNLLGGLSLKC